MQAVIFGANGQDGYYLKQLCEREGLQALLVSRSKGPWLSGDVADFDFVESFIKQHKPAYVFHLAANSTTQHHALFENHESIATGTLNILEACYRHSQHSRIFLSGSAVQFENKGLPINEQTPFAPLSPYAVARIQSVYAGRYYRGLGLRVYVGYFFNHDSPLRTERHVNQKIALAVHRIGRGSTEKIEVGNVNVRKEFNYAGDVMQAVWQLINQDEVFEAVVGCGKAHSIQDWIEVCFLLIGKKPEGYIVQKEAFTPEYNLLVSDPRLLFSLGYRPQVDIKGLAAMMVNN